MTFDDTMENVAQIFESVGVAVIVIGGIGAMLLGAKDFRNLNEFYADVRRNFGRPLILGLEILVAADIIKTITASTKKMTIAVARSNRTYSTSSQMKLATTLTTTNTR